MFLNLFFKILMHQSSAHFGGRFRLKGTSRQTFNIIVSTKCVFKIPKHVAMSS